MQQKVQNIYKNNILVAKKEQDGEIDGEVQALINL
jgi:hypothetical protein